MSELGVLGESLVVIRKVRVVGERVGGRGFEGRIVAVGCIVSRRYGFG